MIASFIVRLLDAEGNLLAWTEVMAKSEPQGRPRSTPLNAQAPSEFVITRDGLASHIAIHWASEDVARLTELMNPTQVNVGQVMRFDWIQPLYLLPGSMGISVMELERFQYKLKEAMAQYDDLSDEMEGLQIAWKLLERHLKECEAQANVPLPPVTVTRPVTVAPPPAAMGAAAP